VPFPHACPRRWDSAVDCNYPTSVFLHCAIKAVRSNTLKKWLDLVLVRLRQM
jgi:hypothetical protein